MNVERGSARIPRAVTQGDGPPATHIFRIKLFRHTDELREPLHAHEALLVAGEARLRAVVQGRDQQVFDRAKVIEDERLVEASARGDVSCAGLSKAAMTKRLERCLDDLPACGARSRSCHPAFLSRFAELSICFEQSLNSE